MGVLKSRYKLKGSSLVETIVATIIITIVFAIATISVTRILKQSIDSSTHEIDTQLQRLTYLSTHGKLLFPDSYEFGSWNVEAKRITQGQVSFVVFTAKHKKTQKVIIKKSVE